MRPPPTSAAPKPRKAAEERVGVVDIGSNSVRLVTYDGSGRAPVPMFNEKVLCGLGRGIASSGRLDPQGVDLALRTLERFAALKELMQLDRLDLVATAAVRDAEDGAAFVTRAEAAVGQPIRVLSGQEEAFYSAEGVISAIPDAAGLVGDLGGGSLELVGVQEAQVGQQVTLPLGPLRLIDVFRADKAKATAQIDETLARLPWIDAFKGMSFYAVGGAWRALGKLHMSQTSYPLRVLHHYVIPRGAVRDLSRLVAGLSRESLERVSGLPKRRLDTLPIAALILDRVLKAAKPRQMVFSSYGLREGLLFSRLDAEARRLDPLLEMARDVGRQFSRYPLHGDELAAWMAPLFDAEGEAEYRLRQASCHLSDIGWREHPDYRAQQSLFQVLRGTYVGLDHQDRAVLALAVYARYDGDFSAGTARQAAAVLDAGQIARARMIGAVLRLGHAVSGGVDGVLRETRLEREEGALVLHLPPRLRRLRGEVGERRLAAVAALANLASRIVADP